MKRWVGILVLLAVALGLAAVGWIGVQTQPVHLSSSEEQALLRSVLTVSQMDDAPSSQDSYVLLAETDPMNGSPRSWLQKTLRINAPRPLTGSGKSADFEYVPKEEVTRLRPSYRGDWTDWNKRFPNCRATVVLVGMKRRSADAVDFVFTLDRIGDGMTVSAECRREKGAWFASTKILEGWAI